MHRSSSSLLFSYHYNVTIDYVVIRRVDVWVNPYHHNQFFLPHLPLVGGGNDYE